MPQYWKTLVENCHLDRQICASNCQHASLAVTLDAINWV
jgi:hypothetical protein